MEDVMQRGWLGTMTLAACMVGGLATGALADPVGVGGVYFTQPFGAISTNQLTLTFPDFAIDIFDNDAPSNLALRPGFDVPNNSPVSFTQNTGDFSLHSTAFPQNNVIDATVSGHLSFVGPTELVNVPSDCAPLLVCSQTLTAPVTMSGFLTVQQGSHILFRGSLKGGGSAMTMYQPSRPSQFWQGSQYSFAAAAQTPEPGSIVLLGSGVAWLVRRRRPRPETC
jgi:hypothetical protein